jgi:hypothetical protein
MRTDHLSSAVSSPGTPDGPARVSGKIDAARAKLRYELRGLPRDRATLAATR